MMQHFINLFIHSLLCDLQKSGMTKKKIEFLLCQSIFHVLYFVFYILYYSTAESSMIFLFVFLITQYGQREKKK